MRQFLKHALNALCVAVAAVPAVTCWLFQPHSPDPVYSFWTHFFAFLPGLPGVYLRRAFYRLTLDGFGEDVTIDLGAILGRRHSSIGRGSYIGAYALVGWVSIGEHALIGSRASLLSGAHQHEWRDGRWTPTDQDHLRQIAIGAHAWIGEGAIVMADVGAGSMVAAGAVVGAAIPDGVMVAGNPARFVRRVMPMPREVTADATAATALH